MAYRLNKSFNYDSSELRYETETQYEQRISAEKTKKETERLEYLKLNTMKSNIFCFNFFAENL